MNERTDNLNEMSINQLRDELRGAWNRLRNVKAIIDDDFDRRAERDTPMRENVAGDVQARLHHLLAENERLTALVIAMRHDLTTTDGLYAMDKPIRSDDAFQITHLSIFEQ